MKEQHDDFAAKVITSILMVALNSFFLKILWNSSAVTVFGAQPLTYSHAVNLTVIVWILADVFHRRRLLR